MPRAPTGTPELDDLTLARARRGERVACARFVSFYERPVFAVLSRILGPHGRGSRVEDLAQETFLRALRALPRFVPGGPARLSTWLLTIATRQALTELGRRRPEAVAFEDTNRPEAGSAHGNPEQVHARRALEGAIAELTPQQRAVFVLRDVHELTETEVAEVLEIGVAAVKSRLFRARARLRILLDGEQV